MTDTELAIIDAALLAALNTLGPLFEGMDLAFVAVHPTNPNSHRIMSKSPLLGERISIRPDQPVPIHGRIDGGRWDSSTIEIEIERVDFPKLPIGSNVRIEVVP